MGEISFPLTCRWCGHNLQGHKFDGHCPGCNRGIWKTLDLTLFDPNSLEVITDVRCVKCGYNLRTLAIHGACPECAHPVANSLHPNELHYANYEWLKKVYVGVIFLLLWIFGFLLAVPCLLSAFNHPPIMVVFSWVHGMLWSVGVFLFSSPENSPKRIPISAWPISAWPNWMARLAAVGYQLMLILAWAFSHSMNGLLGPFMMVIALGFYMVGSVGLILCMRQLAKRGKRPDIQRLTIIQLVLSVATWLMVLGIQIFGWYLTSIYRPGARLSGWYLSEWFSLLQIVIAGIMILTSYILAIFLLFKLLAMLNEVIEAPLPTTPLTYTERNA